MPEICLGTEQSADRWLINKLARGSLCRHDYGQREIIRKPNKNSFTLGNCLDSLT